eukprot:CAMPEP_0178371722 /NCGR_PEP_ID=MMETSP0689_2-20121128/974_1 /TAXON_ID=160604 /ORGANISM="Amphidinium massartii, Strain CS-259" /LENGTH=69 /DNA_ID=CAMNT_0019991603 /DNA_START=572 /DNA_END=777 /DNA_ORIENTATION=+
MCGQLHGDCLEEVVDEKRHCVRPIGGKDVWSGIVRERFAESWRRELEVWEVHQDNRCEALSQLRFAEHA